MKTVRLWFKKINGAKYISHLDIVRLFTRCIRRSRLPVWYTEGYNPHLHMVFAQPLPIGMEALKEAVDIKIEDDLCQCEKIFEALSPVMPENVPLIGVTDPVNSFSDISGAEYAMRLSLPDNLTAGELSDFLNGSITVKKPAKKKKGRHSSAQPEFKEIAVSCRLLSFKAEDSTAEATVILPAGSSLNINPPLIIEAASEKFGSISAESITRTCLLVGENELR